MAGDLIRVTRIAVFGRHGVLAEEAVLGQRFYISLEAELDLGPAGRSDDVAGTVSYADLTAVAVAIATERRFNLIEALAETVAAEILARFAQVDAITVQVDKPSAPVPAILDSVGVAITRRRGAGR
ncbi:MULTISPECIES: dihydroneopterin aldolase [Methylobacterium]|jgi:7,8-dihydroneopterin aldolase/epimerase/oxygenase|uniref:dihydroneopterin aldolase n=1 Tax=Methylobacterium TaxID=407 RepID=UPI00034DE15C|nr:MULTISPECIES: dihydroneopterin aldolase [Methylobacterium]KQS85964.1 dienelactone hydrolase [Methylobacterium sp. Leaf361]MBN4094001.1 dihydroneopterin aldolase [Methylobacterium sp. OT2]UIN33562.1 dihydroneopterin aldolase [Methylobacterium oryzae]SFD93256.1 dihydroneopterin aldolase [Methylobacterium sp. 13MFTsu3.1M2]SFS37483.1 dihydroneopterin aldolase [Methylobacterium sp. yr668]